MEHTKDEPELPQIPKTPETEPVLPEKPVTPDQPSIIPPQPIPGKPVEIPIRKKEM